jgi:hypothetical protein
MELHAVRRQDGNNKGSLTRDVPCPVCEEGFLRFHAPKPTFCIQTAEVNG